MKIEQRPVGSITPYEKNAKHHPASQVEKVAASIREFGFNQPIVVDKDGVIIVGHGRWLAAQHLGLKMAPVVVADLPDERVKAYRLADNKLNESEWDMGLVIPELKLLTPEMRDLAGFGEFKLKERVEFNAEINTGALSKGMAECPKCHFRFDPVAHD